MAKKKTNLELREFYAIGKHAAEVRNKRIIAGKGIHGTLEGLGAKDPAAKNRLMEALRFAKLYDERQLDDICALGQKTGRPLTRFHVVQLTRVRDRRRRNSLAKKCAAGSWSVRQLEREVKRVGPRHNYGGRKHEPPRSLDEALLVTEQMAKSWARWIDVLNPAKPAVRNQITINQLPLSIQRLMNDVLGKAEALSKLIGRRLEKK